MSATLETLHAQLATELQTRYDLAKRPFDIPALPEAQCIVIPLIREAIAPILVRNNDADEITDMVLAGQNRVRIIASKLKGVERRRGAQILRALGMGGRAAANKAFVPKDRKPSEVFDLNSFVFGDSGTGLISGKEYVFPIHAAVLYSDAVSIQPKRDAINTFSSAKAVSPRMAVISMPKPRKAAATSLRPTRSIRAPCSCSRSSCPAVV